MFFDSKNYPAIKNACIKKQNIEITVPIEITPFSDNDAPQVWTSYPMCILNKKDYAQVLLTAGFDARGSLTKLEMSVQENGGQIQYKANGKNQIAIKINW